MGAQVQNGCQAIGVYACDHVTDRELRLSGSTRREYSATRSGERSKSKVQNIVSVECITLSHHHKVEKSLC